MGCGCGQSSWTPTPPSGVTVPEEAGGPRGIENPATFWTGPETPPVAAPKPEPVTAGAE